MKSIIFILTLALLSASCSSTKKTMSRVEKLEDSTTHRAVTTVTDQSATVKSRVEKDSVIGIAKRNVEDNVTKSDLEIPRTPAGKAVERHYQKYKDGVRAYATIDTNGNLKYGCDVDSITLVVRSLIRDSISTHRQYDSLTALYERHASVQQTTVIATKVKTQGWLAKNWIWIAGSVVCVVIIICRKWLGSYYKMIRP